MSAPEGRHLVGEVVHTWVGSEAGSRRIAARDARAGRYLPARWYTMSASEACVSVLVDIEKDEPARWDV